MVSVFDATALHAYWSTAGLTRWNALRWRQFPNPGRPRFATECGRDKVNDGPNGTPLPSATGDNFGWQAQGIDGDQFLRELADYDAELRADGVYGVVFTTSPDDEWARKGFSMDDLAERCHFTNLGPHDLEGRSPQALAWAARAPIVKSVDQTAAIRRARSTAITIYRKRFTPTEQDDILERCDAAHLVGAIDERLDGFRHPNLYVELLNEVGKGRRDQYLALARIAVPMLRVLGLRVAGPSWATGDYDADDWAAFTGGTMSYPDFCPFAVLDLAPAGLYDAVRDVDPATGRPSLPTMIVDHTQDGGGNPMDWWRQLVAGPVSKRASAAFSVAKSGLLRQHGRLSWQMWANGHVDKPNLANALIAALVKAGRNPNAATVAIEHEGRPGEPLTVAQLATSKRLHAWLGEALAITLDRTHVVGHYEFDSVTRGRCPSFAPTTWTALLAGGTVKPDPAAPAGRFPDGRPVPSSADYDAHVWTPLQQAANALTLASFDLENGGDRVGDAADAHGIVALRDGILTLKAKSEQRHGIVR